MQMVGDSGLSHVAYLSILDSAAFILFLCESQLLTSCIASDGLLKDIYIYIIVVSILIHIHKSDQDQTKHRSRSTDFETLEDSEAAGLLAAL